MQLNVQVRNKIATYIPADEDYLYVCGNSGNTILFDFDEEWYGYNNKTARFIVNGEHYDVEFTGEECEIPVFEDSNKFIVGVYVGEIPEDEDILSTTRAEVDCEISIRHKDSKPSDETGENYTNLAFGYSEQAKDSANNAKLSEENAKDYAEAAEQAKNDAESRINEATRIVQETGDDESAVMSQKAVTEELDHLSEQIADNYKIAIYLKAGTDLDTITEPGVYYCDAYSVGSTLLNCPDSNAFKLVVDNVYSSTRPQQIFYGSLSGYIYRRTMTSLGWSEWNRFATYDELVDERKIAMFGDSITSGTNGNGGGRVTNTYPKIVGEKMKITCDNHGVGTSGYLNVGDDGRIAFEKISSTDITGYDYITLAFGVNDVLKYTLGEWNSTDETTIMGQMNKVINYIYEQNPNCVIIVIGAWNGRNVGTFPKFKYGNERMIAMDEAYKTLCEYYGIPYISQKDCPINGFTMSTLMGSDGVHPSILGYERIGCWLAGKLKALIG